MESWITIKLINGHGNTENLSPATSLAYFGIEKQKAKGLEIFGSEAFCFFDLVMA